MRWRVCLGWLPTHDAACAAITPNGSGKNPTAAPNWPEMALWVHRRYLSYYWINRITNPIDNGFACKVEQEMISALDCFLGEEIELIHSCLHIPSEEFDDARAQARHAATYMLWISKKIILSPEYKFQEKLKEAGDLKSILINASPEKSLIWDRLLDQLSAESEKNI